MRHHSTIVQVLALALVFAVPALAQEHQEQGRQEQGRQEQGRQEQGHPAARGPAPHGEQYGGPQRYEYHGEPSGSRNRPPAVDRGEYAHNFQAPRQFHIGPYHRPRGWEPHHWAFGQILPRVYWGSEYFVGDYWLFGLPVPPVGFEWVRDDDDAILVNIASGEILQVHYGIFG